MKKRASSSKASSRRPARREDTDPYYDLLCEHESGIRALYGRFEDKKPLLLFVVDEAKVYCVPYDQYRAGLSERSQESLKEQYEEACANHAMVVFVRDDTNRVLKSYTLAV